MQPTPAIACLCLVALTHRAHAGDDWSSLDEEVQALTTALANQHAGEDAAQLSGFINFLYANSSDVAVVPSGEDLGGGLQRETLTLGLNRYLLGHDAKVLLNYRTTDSDAGDEDILGVGFSLSF